MLKELGDYSGPTANLLQVLGFIGLPTIPALIGWVIRERLLRRKEKEHLWELVKNLKGQVAAGKAREATLNARLGLQAPRCWLEHYELEVNRGRPELGLAQLAKGFAAVRDDLRSALYKLSRHYYATASDTDADSRRMAWYFSTIASAIRDDEDVRLVRDGLRENDAEAARAEGLYDPSAPDWNQFESIPGFSSTEQEIAHLLKVMNNRARELANTGKAMKANRLQARTLYIANLHFGPTSQEVLTIRGNAAGMCALILAWESVLSHAQFVADALKKQGSGADQRRLHMMRHLMVAALMKLGRLDEGQKEGEALLRELKEQDVLTYATSQLLKSKPASPTDRGTVGSSIGYFELKEGKRVPPPSGFPPLGGA